MTGINYQLALEAVRVAEVAALAASRLTGLGDEKAADQAAVDAMRSALNELPMSGTVVIGEGERDEAPMLYIGEEVGQGGAGSGGAVATGCVVAGSCVPRIPVSIILIIVIVVSSSIPFLFIAIVHAFSPSVLLLFTVLTLLFITLTISPWSCAWLIVVVMTS